MNFTQNQKINQVSEQTLVIGIDIASELNYARAFDQRGIEKDKVFKFFNNLEGFQAFKDWTAKVMAANNLSELLVAAEPTAKSLYEAAVTSVGRKEGSVGSRAEFRMLWEDYAHKLEQLEQLNKELAILLKEIP